MNRKHLVAAALLIACASPLSAQSVKDGVDAWQRGDYAGAVAIWRPLADKGDPDAEFNLGQAYRFGWGVQTNLSAAQTWLQRSANGGNLKAQTTLGLLLFENGSQADGLKWLKKAADQGEPRALLIYGTALVNGDGVTQDPVLGYAFVSRAAAQGLEQAKQTLDALDKMLSLQDRMNGVDMARKLAKAAPASTGEAGIEVQDKPASKRKQVAKAKAEPKPVKTAESAPAPQSTAATGGSKVTEAARPTGNWRIQLGAFSEKGNAQALFKKLSGNSVLAGRSPFYVSAGAITRLQIGPFDSKTAAAAACGRLGVACFPVPAK